METWFSKAEAGSGLGATSQGPAGLSCSPGLFWHASSPLIPVVELYRADKHDSSTFITSRKTSSVMGGSYPRGEACLGLGCYYWRWDGRVIFVVVFLRKEELLKEKIAFSGWQVSLQNIPPHWVAMRSGICQYWKWLGFKSKSRGEAARAFSVCPLHDHSSWSWLSNFKGSRNWLHSVLPKFMQLWAKLNLC